MLGMILRLTLPGVRLPSSCLSGTLLRRKFWEVLSYLPLSSLQPPALPLTHKHSSPCPHSLPRHCSGLYNTQHLSGDIYSIFLRHFHSPDLEKGMASDTREWMELLNSKMIANSNRKLENRKIMY